MFEAHLERDRLYSPGIALESMLYCSRTDAERETKEVSARVMALVIPLLHLAGAFISLMAIPASLLALIPTCGNSLIVTVQAPGNVIWNLACCGLSLLEIPQKLWNGPHQPPAYFNTHNRYARYESYTLQGARYTFQITDTRATLISTTDRRANFQDSTLYDRIARA